MRTQRHPPASPLSIVQCRDNHEQCDVGSEHAAQPVVERLAVVASSATGGDICIRQAAPVHLFLLTEMQTAGANTVRRVYCGPPQCRGH